MSISIEFPEGICDTCRENMTAMLLSRLAPREDDAEIAKSRAELLDLIYRFYPRGMHDIHRRHVTPGELVYDDTEEHVRLVEAAARGRREHPT
jgi:hypothetical protein